MKGLIIGCGQIGSFYDTPESEQVHTHAHSFHRSNLIDEFAFVEIDQEKLDQAVKLWGARGYRSLSEAMADGFSPDIVCVSTPPGAHLPVLEEVIAKGIKKVILEKPISDKLESASRIIHLAHESKTVVNVNYPRRFDTSMGELKKTIEDGLYGKLESVRCLYTKGMLNGGSHMINLFLFLLGRYHEGSVFSSMNDYTIEDPSLDCFLKFEKCSNVVMSAVNSKNYFLTEYEFIFEKSRLTFFNRGFEFKLEELRSDPVFPGYKDLEMKKGGRTGLSEYLDKLLTNTLESENSEQLFSSLEDAYQSMEICMDLIGSIKE